MSSACGKEEVGSIVVDMVGRILVEAMNSIERQEKACWLREYRVQNLEFANCEDFERETKFERTERE